MALTIPTCRAYDPAFGYELAVIIEEGINAMYVRGEECFYYLTVYNESYDMPAMPGEHVREGIIAGLYPLKTVRPEGAKHEVQLLGSGVILNEALRAQQILAEKYGIASTVYSATSYQMLRRDAHRVRAAQPPAPRAAKKVPYVSQVLGKTKGPIVATSDYMRAVPEQVAPVPRRPARWRSAPMASAAAKRARPCGGSSRWMRNTWRSPRCRPWPTAASSTGRWSRRRSRNWA